MGTAAVGISAAAGADPRHPAAAGAAGHLLAAAGRSPEPLPSAEHSSVAL